MAGPWRGLRMSECGTPKPPGTSPLNWRPSNGGWPEPPTSYDMKTDLKGSQPSGRSKLSQKPARFGLSGPSSAVHLAYEMLT